MNSAVVLASGGINSTVVMANAAREAEVSVVYLDHGAPAAAREHAAVQAVARSLGIRRVLTLDLAGPAEIEKLLRQGESGVMAADVLPAPGHIYGIMPAMLLAGVQWASRIGAPRVLCGASQVADESESESLPGEGIPDRRAEFFHVFNMMLESALPPRRHVTVRAPLIDMTRDEIVRLGARVEAPFHLAWACHRGGTAPCGVCPGCRSRAKAFTAAGIAEPTGARE